MSESTIPNTNRQILLAKYTPIVTTPFFFGFSTHVLSPKSIARFLGPQAESPIASSLWFGSHIGIGIYIYNSKHLRNAETFERLLYSVYGSTLFNFGTVLVMSIIRTNFPDNDLLRLGIGLSTSAAILYMGKRYINFIDQVFEKVRFRGTPP